MAKSSSVWSAILATTLVAGSAHGDSTAPGTGDGGASSRAAVGADVETFGVARGTAVLSPAVDGAAVAVCAGRTEPFTQEDAAGAEVSRRGGSTWAQAIDGTALACILVPEAELELALWISARRLHAQAATPSLPMDDSDAAASLARAAAIAGEGAALDDAAGAPAFTVVVAGGDGARARELVVRYFGETTPAPERAVPHLRISQTSERFSELARDGSARLVRYAFIAPNGDDDAATRVALEILAGNDGARLPRLFATRQLGRRAEAFRLAVPGGAVSGLLVEPVSRVSIDRARRFVDGALKQLRIVGPTRRELERARNRLLLAAYRTWEDPLERAKLLASYEMTHGGALHAAEDLRALASVAAPDVARAVKNNLCDGRRTTIEEYPRDFPSDDPRLAKSQLYTVQPGDTLARMAERFRVSIAALARANDLDPKYALSPGQPLWIPGAE